MSTLQAISDKDPWTGHEADSLLKAIRSFVFYLYNIILDLLLKVTGLILLSSKGSSIVV